jgi:hypothetical protein
MRLPRTTLITVTITACILLSFLLLLVADAGSCNTGDCSKHAGVLPTDQEAGNDTIAPTSNSAASATRKDQYQEKTSTSKKNSPHESPASQINRKGKGFTKSMDVQNSHTKTDVGVLRDYDSYDSSPTLVKPPFKVIQN